jgi:hypothetical protein
MEIQADQRFPCHDPPVAWREPWGLGFDIFCYPSRGWFVRAGFEARYMDPEPVIIDQEPGRLPSPARTASG